jgi:hypothetical protein
VDLPIEDRTINKKLSAEERVNIFDLEKTLEANNRGQVAALIDITTPARPFTAFDLCTDHRPHSDRNRGGAL